MGFGLGVDSTGRKIAVSVSAMPACLPFHQLHEPTDLARAIEQR